MTKTNAQSNQQLMHLLKRWFLTSKKGFIDMNDGHL